MSVHPTDDPGLTRIVIIPAGKYSAAQEFWADSWALLRQDNGATLKMLASGDGTRPRRTRTSKLASALGAIAGAITGS